MIYEDYLKLENGLWECINAGFQGQPCEVIWQNQDGDKPESPYATILVEDDLPSQKPEYRTQPDGNILTVLNYELTLSVNTWGKGALAVLKNFRNNISKRSFRDLCAIKFEEAGICASYISASNVSNLTALLESSMEERGRLEIIFRYVDQILDTGEDDQGLGIKKFNVTGRVKASAADGATEITKTSVILDGTE